MLIPKVKICGITNLEDANAAIDAGADLLGFNFYKKSPRYIDPEEAQKIINKLPGFIDIVGLFVNSSYQEIRKTMNKCYVNWLQFHGDEDVKFCQSFNDLNLNVMKAIRVKNYSDIKNAENFFTDALLFDAYDPDKYGGSGIQFDWNIMGNINKRVFLAGGIDPDNIEEAVKLGVYGIDLCSGVESSPGKKDHKKLRQLFDNISHLRA